MESTELNQAFLAIVEIIQRKEKRILELEEENKLLKEQNKRLLHKEVASSVVVRDNFSSNTTDRLKLYSKQETPQFPNHNTASATVNQKIIRGKDTSLNPEKNHHIEIPSKKSEKGKARSKQLSHDCLIYATINEQPLSSPKNISSSSPLTPQANTFSTSPQSKGQVKLFLSEVREKVPLTDFYEFIKYIRILTDKSQNFNRKEIFEKVRLLFGDKHSECYAKFEELLSVKK